MIGAIEPAREQLEPAAECGGIAALCESMFEEALLIFLAKLLQRLGHFFGGSALPNAAKLVIRSLEHFALAAERVLSAKVQQILAALCPLRHVCSAGDSERKLPERPARPVHSPPAGS